jgi:hypothetical protein
MTENSCIVGHEDDGSEYVYAILGPMTNGELLAVEI